MYKNVRNFKELDISWRFLGRTRGELRKPFGDHPVTMRRLSSAAQASSGSAPMAKPSLITPANPLSPTTHVTPSDSTAAPVTPTPIP
ncbi:hypothetical protein J6590_032284 [Homalodisca vitripennis]|nr:hypothetical protein J6590_032284 [Homalodisca vitripennis]